MSATIYKGKRDAQRNMYFPTMMESNQAPRVNLSEVTVLPRAEWNRIKDTLADESHADRVANAEAEEKRVMAEKSKALVGTWTNTITGQRLKKLQARRIREEKEEEERKAIDVEEEKYQAEKRREVLDEAKKLQYWKTDRVKNLHSALTLTEVLRERDEQLKLKRRLKSAASNLDAELAAKYERENQEAMEKEKRESMARHQQALATRDYVVGQVKGRKGEKDRERLRDKMEGIEIQDALRQHDEEMMRIAQIKEEEKKQLLKAHEETLRNKDLMEAIERQNEEEKDDQIRRFAMAKREMARLRAKREREIHDEKMKIRDQQTEHLGNILRKMKNTEEDRMNNALAEKEEKDARDEAEKMKQQMEMFESINKHRIETQKMREEREKKERMEAIEMRQARLMADQLFQEHEEKKAADRFENDRALKQLHLEQYKEKKEKLAKLKNEELANDFKSLELQRLEAEQFQKYAKEVIEEEKQRGAKNLYPLVKVANDGQGGGRGPVFDLEGNLRPSYQSSDKDGKEMPCYQAPGASNTKKGQTNNTSKRLGFVWKT